MQKIVILDFGSQYTQLIARRVREFNIYCEIHPFNTPLAIDKDTIGVILSGSPCSVLDKNAPNIPLEKITLPLLGICYGAQLLAKQNKGNISKSTHREYGRSQLNHIQDNPLFEGIEVNTQVWMSHGDSILNLPSDFKILASSSTIPIAAFQMVNTQKYGIQFHPEVTHTEMGKMLIKNFAVNICQAQQSWTPSAFVTQTISEIQENIGQDKVIMGLSGGVDSSVAAELIHQAIGKNLFCVFVDNGLLRKNEYEEVLDSYQKMGLNVKGVDAKKSFYKALKNVKDPEKKRKAIGKTFIEIFDSEAKKIKNIKWLGQGTIYPDIIESVSVKGPSVTIKSHHNVGGLPKKMKLKVIEPLDTLFKDDVRRVGKALQIPNAILSRHPFPGPGLGIRILGEITEKKVQILQNVDEIYISMLKAAGIYDKIWQAGAILLPIHSVGVMGDERTYENVVALRAVTSVDGMTADWYPMPYEWLAKISNQIINEVKGVNRVVYDVSSKPPATIEWE